MLSLMWPYLLKRSDAGLSMFTITKNQLPVIVAMGPNLGELTGEISLR